MHILLCVGSKFCVKFQRAHLKFHTKFSTHTPQNMHFTVFYFYMWFTTSLNCDVISLSETGPWDSTRQIQKPGGSGPQCLVNIHSTVYPKKYAHGFVVLCFVVVTQSFIMNSHEVFIHIHQGCSAGTGAIVRLPQCQWSKPDGYGKISQCITTTKHNKAKTVCIFLGIYCTCQWFCPCLHPAMVYPMYN